MEKEGSAVALLPSRADGATERQVSSRSRRAGGGFGGWDATAMIRQLLRLADLRCRASKVRYIST